MRMRFRGLMITTKKKINRENKFHKETFNKTRSEPIKIEAEWTEMMFKLLKLASLTWISLTVMII